ncbi:UDP-arabinopyranose mutase [Ranunculus cassubicifolius]
MHFNMFSGFANGNVTTYHQVELSGENTSITYKPDGAHSAVGNKDHELTILDVRKFKPIHMRKFNYDVNEIAWNITGEMFLLTTENGTNEVLAYIPYS